MSIDGEFMISTFCLGDHFEPEPSFQGLRHSACTSSELDTFDTNETLSASESVAVLLRRQLKTPHSKASPATLKIANL
jgi:hypothetical protein